MKYVVLGLVVVFAVWQLISLVKTIKDNKNKKALISSDSEDQNKKDNSSVPGAGEYIEKK